MKLSLTPTLPLTTDSKTLTSPNQVAALGRAGGDTKLLTFERDPAIEAIVGSWPRNFETDRAHAMGFAPAEDIDAAIQSHLAETLEATSAR